MMADDGTQKLPCHIRERLAQLQLELSEGDITEKGFEKKKKQLLSQFENVSLKDSKPSPNTRHRRSGRRVTREESRFHSEIRAEAVHQAIAEYSGCNFLPPTRRKPAPSRERTAKLSESSSDEESVCDSLPRIDASSKTQSKESSKARTICEPPTTYIEIMPDLTSIAQSAPSAAQVHAMLRDVEQRREQRNSEYTRVQMDTQTGHVCISAIMEPPPLQSQIEGVDDAVYVNTRTTTSPNVESPNGSYQNDVLPLKVPKVSQKIHQAQNALQRPKTRALQEFYNDDDVELEAIARMQDPSAPRPEGPMMNPVRGDPLSPTSIASPSNATRSIESAMIRTANTSPRAVMGFTLGHGGKTSDPLTYGKLLSRTKKIAYHLMHKTVTVGRDHAKIPLCKPGDRVALIYPNTEPLGFVTAFYGCLLAGVVPVPMEVPLTKRDAGIQQLGFLLGSCGVKVALTSEICYKGLPKSQNTSQAAPTSVMPSGSINLTGASHEIVDFKGWPRMYWIITDDMAKPPRDWEPPARVADDSTAYIEYSSDVDGEVKGVCVSRMAALVHCRALTAAMGYKQGDTLVCVLDFKRELGLWHAVLAAIVNAMRVIFVPYSLMKVNPSSWMLAVTKHQASTALVKSRDLHWALLATKDHREVNLSSLRSLIVADGANPWSLSSCDHFASTFAGQGLRMEAMCPCAGSSETGTIALRKTTSSSSGRGIISMGALSHSVVRVDVETSLTSLTLQDAGQVVPGGVVVVIKPQGPPQLCRADEVGELCLSANSCAHAYWGLEGMTSSTFVVEPVGPDGRSLGAAQYVRSGLLGFTGPDGLVFVVGRRNSQLTVSGRQHSADDIIATVLAVEPMKLVYRGRIAVFSVNVLRDERIVVVAEQKANVSEDDAFKWISNVLTAIESIHQTGVYCLALVPANQLPKTPLGGIHVADTRHRFQAGELHPLHVLMSPHSCVLNLPKPRERHADVGPAAIFVGNIVQGARFANAEGRPLGADEEKLTLVDMLKQKAADSPEHRLLSVATAKNGEYDSATCASLLKRSERIGALLLDKARLNVGDHVALLLSGIDLVAAFYGCLLTGLVPVCIRPPTPTTLQSALPTIRTVVEISKAVAILSHATSSRLLKSKEAANCADSKAWPLILDIEDSPSSWKRKNVFELPDRSQNDVCYLDFSASTTGQLAGVVVSGASAMSLCKSLKMSCEFYPSRQVLLCLEPYSGLELALWCLASIYAGHHTILIPPCEVEAQPSLWLNSVSTLKVRDTFTTHAIIERCIIELASAVPSLKEKGVNLSCLRSCVLVAEERPRVGLVATFSKIFSPLSLSPRAVSISFGCRVNAAICMQGASGPESSTVYVDARALRNDRVTLVGKGAPHSVALCESGKLLPGVRVVIANPETRGQCADSHLGEIWVASPHNASRYFTVYGEETSLHTDHFNARLATGDTKSRFARTGYLGFLRQTQAITEAGELHDAVFVVGALDETLMLRGMRYHPVDIETSVSRCHRHVCDSAVFTWTHLLVVVAECNGSESELLDVVPAVTSAVLEQHHLIVGVVVLVDAHRIPVNSRGEKQRNLLRSNFLNDSLDPIYVAYNT